MFTNGKARFTSGEIITLTEKAPVKAEIGLRENVVIIPTYNEAINLKLLVPNILQRGPFDILIVDDNSPDGTGEVAEEFARRFPGRVDVLHRPGKLGLGTAYLAGLHYALEMGYQHVFTMDADFSHDPSRLPALRAALDDADVALGSRYVPGGGTLRCSLWRRILSMGGSAYARLMLGLPIRDLTGGFKGFRRQVLETLLPEMDTMRSNGYAFQIETTYLCSRHDFCIVEVPILFENRLVGKSKLNRHIILEALRVVLALRLSKGSSRTRSNVPPRAPLPIGRAITVIMALIGLLMLGTVNVAPKWVSQLEGGAARLFTRSQMHAISRADSRAKPFSPAAHTVPRASSALIQMQEEDLTSNVLLSFVGSGFLPGEKLTMTMDNSQGRLIANLTPVTADETGQVAVVSETILSDLSPGYIYLQVVGERSHRWGRASFHLRRIPPTLQLDPFSSKPKHDVGFSGNGFIPYETVDVYLGSPAGERWATVHANDVGNIEGHFSVPLMTEGNYTLFFVGRKSQTPASTGLNVQGFHPWVVLDTYAPSPHSRIGFTGEDFVPGEEVLVYLNGQAGAYTHTGTHGPGTPLMRIQVDADGRFVLPAAWEVPQLNGANTLTFVGQESGAVITTTFTVVP